MRNIIKELQEHMINHSKVAEDISMVNIQYKEDYENSIIIHTKENVWKSLIEAFNNTEYNEGFGSQELFGVVAFKDGTWLERGEYDGSEWWEYKSTPDFEDEQW